MHNVFARQRRCLGFVRPANRGSPEETADSEGRDNRCRNKFLNREAMASTSKIGGAFAAYGERAFQSARRTRMSALLYFHLAWNLSKWAGKSGSEAKALVSERRPGTAGNARISRKTLKYWSSGRSIWRSNRRAKLPVVIVILLFFKKVYRMY